MHIGLILYGSLEIVSGGYLYDRIVVDALQERGAQMEIYALPWRSYSRHLTDNLSRDMLHRLSRAPLDILLQDELNHPSLFWLNWRLRKTVSYPILTIVHHLRSSEAHPPLQMRIYEIIERLYLGSVDGFIFNSATTQHVVNQMLPTAKKLPHIIAYPGSDRLMTAISTNQIAARAREPGPLRVLFVGNIIPRKGLHILLEALAQVPRGAAFLQIAGDPQVDPGYSRQISNQIKRLDLSDRVEILGLIRDDQLSRIMTLSHLLIVPSSYEGFGIVYLEGMGFGLPVIATTSGAAHEVITHNQTGFLVNPGDWMEIARLVNQFHQDRKLLLNMSLAAREAHLRYPTWKETTSTIYLFLSEFFQNQKDPEIVNQ